MTRAEFDALVLAAVGATLDGVDPKSDDAKAAEEEAQLLDAECREFADAVDRHAPGIDYGSAVMVEGSAGVVVIDARTYSDAPLYWQTVAGRVDRIVDGTELLPVLYRTAPKQTPAGPA